MKKINKSKFKIINSVHLSDIFECDYYLELGIIDTSVIKRLLNHEIIAIEDITFFDIQNKGLGCAKSKSEKIRNELPFYFFKKFQDSNSEMQLVITYGLSYYVEFDKKDRFAPVILIPVYLYFEGGKFFVRMASRPFENPAIYNIYKKESKLQIIQSEKFNDIYSLDNIIFNLERTIPNSVRLDNYLTFVEKKSEDVIINNKHKFDIDIFISNPGFSKNIYYSEVLTKEQKQIVDRAIRGGNITFSGFNGTGKTTVLENIIINALLNKKNVIYISNSQGSIKQVKDFLDEKGLSSIYTDLCVLNETNSDVKNKGNNQEFIKQEETDKLQKSIDELNSYISSYELEMNQMVADFKFVDILKRLFLVKDYEKMADFELNSLDSLTFLYKNEYINILNALEYIEQNSLKLDSFKDSVWNQIPHINGIKHSNQVYRIVLSLNKDLKKLRDKVYLFKEKGIKNLTNFSFVKSALDPINKLVIPKIPNKWIDDYDVFLKAKENYTNLERAILNYREQEYDLTTKYINLNTINMNDEIKCLYSDIFEEKDLQQIDGYIENLDFYVNEANNTINLLKGFKLSVETASKDLKFEFFNDNKLLDEVNQLIKLIVTYPISGKILDLIINNREGQLLSELEEYAESINTIKNEIDKTFLANPKLHKLIKKNSQRKSVINYYQLITKMRKLEKEYLEKSELTFSSHKLVIETIRELKKYYSNLSNKSSNKNLNNEQYKNIINFVLSINKTNYKEYAKYLKEYLNLYDDINEKIDKFISYGFAFNSDNISDRFRKLYEYALYIKSLESSQERVSKIKIKDNNCAILTSEYYSIKNLIENFDNTIESLRSNAEYKELYDFLYVGELTDFKEIANMLLCFEKYVNLFQNVDYAIKATKEFDDLKMIALEASQLVESIGNFLQLYSNIFKDGVSRYYYSNLDQNIEYLDKLQNSKDELTNYLNITKGLAVLNKYKQNKLINYIINKDKIKGLSNFFTYKYCKAIIDEFLKSNPILSDRDAYFNSLEEVMKLEDQICLSYANNILLKIKQTLPNKHIESNKTRLNDKRLLDSRIKKSRVCLLNTKHICDEIKKKENSIIIVDDAHLISDSKLGTIFKDNQMIICGDYQSNKIAKQTLISYVTNKNTNVFRSRLTLGPRKLTYNMSRTKSPFHSTYEANRGLKVINENIEEMIYNLFLTNNNVKINCYIKNPNEQFELLEKVAKKFIDNKIDEDLVLNFIYENINVTELEKSNYIHSDYDILNFIDYYKENSQIIANNLFEKLMLSRKGLIIYDDNNLLNNDYQYCFYIKIKEMLTNNKIFLGETSDDISNKIYNILKEKGYEVYFPSNGINLTIKQKNSDKLVSLVILFSNGFISNISSNYRFLKKIYENRGHKMIIRTMVDLAAGEEEFIRKLCEEIDG